MTAKAICEANGWKLEILQLDWESLIPAVQSGICDAVIAGQSMTVERMESVDFAGPYLYASIVCLTKKDSKYAEAKGISDLAGAKGASQNSTIWYDIYLKQIKNVEKMAPESAPAMLMALETGTVDFVCTDMPTAQGALIAFPDMALLDFNGSDDNFSINDEDVNIGISVRKGNTVLKDAIDSYLKDKTADDFNKLMDEAIRIQPLSE
jgi:putative lysine transport system substrate-binding protein